MSTWIVSPGTPVRDVDPPRRWWKRPRRKDRPRYRPTLEPLENRWLPSACAGPPTEPWCLDDDFGSSPDGHAIVDISNNLEEARAVHLQDVGGEQRILMAGWAKSSPTAANEKFAIVRLCTDGTLDNGSNCGGNGFGRHVGGGNATGVAVFDFFTHTDSDMERINAIAIQQAESEACGDEGPTDKIVVAGVVRQTGVENATTNLMFGLVRFCANGEVDTDWGGNVRDWDQGMSPSSDDPGTMTVAFVVDDFWSRTSEAYALGVDQNTNQIVVGGFTAFPPDPETPAVTTDFFALARTSPDDTCVTASMNPGCLDLTFGPSDDDPGRIWFDGDGDTDHDHTMDRVHALQLIDNGDDTSDILIAGPDLAPMASDRTFFVARVDSSGTGSPPWAWQTTVPFSGRDAVAWDVRATDESPLRVVVLGTACDSTCPDVEDPNQDFTPASDFALARLESDGMGGYVLDVDFGGNSDGTRLFDIDDTDVGFSLVFQEQDQGSPALVIGGYSAEDEDLPYFSGARFTFDATEDDIDVPIFRSNFSSTSGAPGDQAWELQVQSNRRIVAGGFHSHTIMSSNRPTFAAIRLCKEPGEDPCEDPGNAPSGGGGTGRNPSALPPDAAALEAPPLQTKDDSVKVVTNPGRPERQAADAMPGAKLATVDTPALPAAGRAVDDLFAMRSLQSPWANPLAW
jgi:uncharacterized delta-60 repeat protein